MNQLDVECVVKILKIPKKLEHCGRLFNVFYQYGEVVKIKITEDRVSFVEMKISDCAELALKNLQGLSLFDTQLTLELCSPKGAKNHTSELLWTEDFGQFGKTTNSQPPVRPSKVTFCIILQSYNSGFTGVNVFCDLTHAK